MCFDRVVATIRQMIEQYSARFAQAGVDSPRLNAELLVGFVLGFDRGMVIGLGDRKLTPDQEAQLSKLAQRRLLREPIDYILGEREFYGRRFIVRPGVLIPRPETETIIDVVKREPPRASGWAADIGCGSGALAVTLALEVPGLRVLATDRSKVALQVARENALSLGASRVFMARMDALEAAAGPFTLIVSNPPYIDPDDAANLQPEVGRYEPPEALFGGAQGLETPARFLRYAAQRLAPGGMCVFEHAFNQGEHMRELALQAGLHEVRTVDDLSGLQRVLVARK